MPSARVTTAIAVKAGRLRKFRRPKRISFIKECIETSLYQDQRRQQMLFLIPCSASKTSPATRYQGWFRLFVSQRHQGAHPHCASCRHVASDERHYEQAKCDTRERQDVRRCDP